MKAVRTAEEFAHEVANSRAVVLAENCLSSLDKAVCRENELMRYGLGATAGLFIAREFRGWI